MFDVIIIGGGPAGFTAALYSARAKFNTLLIEKRFAGGQMATTSFMENYPGFEEPISGPELANRMENQAKRFGAKISNEDVIDITLDTVIKKVKTKNNTYHSKVVILCMGAFPKKLGLSSEERFKNAGVSYCATCDGALFRDRAVAVIGGGDTAAEDALYLSRFCSKVYLIYRRDSMRATKVLQDSLLNCKNIEFIWNTTVDDIYGKFDVEGIKIKNNITDETSDLKVDGVFVAIGNVPHTELVWGEIELNPAGYIVTDEKMQTNMFGVFAAGGFVNSSLVSKLEFEINGINNRYYYNCTILLLTSSL